MIRHRVFGRVSGRGCYDCKAEIARLSQMQKSNGENATPSPYECPSCHSRWDRLKRHCMPKLELESFLERFEAQWDTKCTRCGKPICLNGTFGDRGEREPEGLFISGAAYCWDCAEKTAETIEEAAQFFEGSIR